MEEQKEIKQSEEIVEVKKKKRAELKTKFKELKPINFLYLTIAGIINAFGVTLFLFPVKLYDSGISGTSMLLDQITPAFLTLPMFLVVLNIPIFIFGLKRQGLAFTIYSIFTVIIYSLMSYLIMYVLPIDPQGGQHMIVLVRRRIGVHHRG